MPATLNIQKRPGRDENNLKTGAYSLKRLAKLLNDRNTWEWRAYKAYCRYMRSGLKAKTPDKIMQIHECAFIKLRLDLSKIGFFNHGKGIADEHYLSWSNAFDRKLEKLGLQWGDGAPDDLQTYLRRRAEQQETEAEQ